MELIFDERRRSERRRLRLAEQPWPISIAIIDDEPLVRGAIAQMLAGAGIEIVGEAGSAAEAVKLVVDLRPDVVLIDTRLRSDDGLTAIRQISQIAPACKVLVLTRNERNQVVEAIVAGASGYIIKTAPQDAIITAVRATAAGQAVLSPEIAGELLHRVRARDTPATAPQVLASEAIRSLLTGRELEIFTRLASGDSNRQIGEDLGLSANTVANHVASMLDKLHLENRVQAAVHAVRSGIS
jgi:DNA-binding NarL/FixJ family response regulator